MGSCIGSLLGTCVCTACSSAFNKTNPFIGYLLIFFVMTLFAIIAEYTFEASMDLPYNTGSISASDSCSSDACTGNSAVFRTSFALTIFYSIHFVISCIPKCSQGLSSFMFCQLLALITFTVGTFWMDNDTFKTYGDVARVGSGFFLLLQTVILIDWALLLNQWILAKAAETNAEGKEKAYILFVLLFVCVVLVGLSYTGMSLSIKDYGGIYMMQNITEALHPECLSRYDTSPWYCFMVPLMFIYIQTPFFMFNSRFDLWQLKNTLQVPCYMNREECSWTDNTAITAYGEIFIDEWELVKYNPNHGAAVSSCVCHGYLWACEWQNRTYPPETGTTSFDWYTKWHNGQTTGFESFHVDYRQPNGDSDDYMMTQCYTNPPYWENPQG